MFSIRRVLRGVLTLLQSLRSILLLTADGLQVVISSLTAVLEWADAVRGSAAQVKAEERSVP